MTPFNLSYRAVCLIFLEVVPNNIFDRDVNSLRQTCGANLHYPAPSDHNLVFVCCAEVDVPGL